MTTLSIDLESNLDVAERPPLKRREISPGKVRIVLEENENIPPTGLFLGLNGASFMLRPGVEADVPQGIVDILDHAVMTTTITHPITGQTIGYRNKRRYSYIRV